MRLALPSTRSLDKTWSGRIPVLTNVFCPAGHSQAIGMEKLRAISEGIANRFLELG